MHLNSEMGAFPLGFSGETTAAGMGQGDFLRDTVADGATQCLSHKGCRIQIPGLFSGQGNVLCEPGKGCRLGHHRWPSEKATRDQALEPSIF